MPVRQAGIGRAGRAVAWLRWQKIQAGPACAAPQSAPACCWRGGVEAQCSGVQGVSTYGGRGHHRPATSGDRADCAAAAGAAPGPAPGPARLRRRQQCKCIVACPPAVKGMRDPSRAHGSAYPACVPGVGRVAPLHRCTAPSGAVGLVAHPASRAPAAPLLPRDRSGIADRHIAAPATLRGCGGSGSAPRRDGAQEQGACEGQAQQQEAQGEEAEEQQAPEALVQQQQRQQLIGRQRCAAAAGPRALAIGLPSLPPCLTRAAPRLARSAALQGLGSSGAARWQPAPPPPWPPLPRPCNRPRRRARRAGARPRRRQHAAQDPLLLPRREARAAPGARRLVGRRLQAGCAKRSARAAPRRPSLCCGARSPRRSQSSAPAAPPTWQVLWNIDAGQSVHLAGIADELLRGMLEQLFGSLQLKQVTQVGRRGRGCCCGAGSAAAEAQPRGPVLVAAAGASAACPGLWAARRLRCRRSAPA
jgi:hypothetical protein